MINNNVLVTGSKGFFGSHIVDALKRNDYNPITFTSSARNLLKYDDAYRAVNESNAPYVIHAAALSGGIVWNQKHRDDIYFKNVLMSNNLLRAISKFPRVKKVISIISSCAYPDIDHRDIVEDDLWYGLPAKSIRAFGMQKRNIVAYSMTLGEQYPNQRYICPIINNLYGPRDTFDLERTKVVGAVIRKIYEAKMRGDKKITFFGTGEPTRQFTYVVDAAQAVVKLLENDEIPDIINISTTEETAIHTLVKTVANLLDYDGEIWWDTDKPNGQMRKSMNCELANEFGIECKTLLRQGLEETIRWYLENQV